MPCYPGLNQTKKLDDIATAMTDNEAADYLQQQRQLLFKHIHEDCRKSA